MSPQASKFRESALASKLVTEDQLQLAIAKVMDSPRSKLAHPNQISDKRIASKLVEMKVISAYQADQLRSGRSKLTLGPYIIVDWIGQGGMGQVFKAVHKMLGRECAVKVLPLHKTTPDAIENFRREIRAQAKLDHPNLVRAYDAGEDGNVHYLVVEYVKGTDLRRLVRTNGRLSVQRAASIIKRLPFAGTDQDAVANHQCQRYLLVGLHALLRGHGQGAVPRWNSKIESPSSSGRNALASTSVQRRGHRRLC